MMNRKRNTLGRKTKNYLNILFVIFFLSGLLYNTALADGRVNLRLYKPAPNMLGVGDLWKLDITNTTRENINIYLTGTATETKKGLIVSGKSKVISVNPGTKRYHYNDFKSGEVDWKDKSIQEVLLRTGNVPEGEYTICVTAFYENNEIADEESCIEQSVQQLNSISLISPDNNAEPIQNQPVLFTWIPLPKGGPYSLRIVELKESQPPEIEIIENRPILNKSGINLTTYQYGLADPKLEPGKKYAWQVKSNNIESETWVFKFSSADVVTDTLDTAKKLLKNSFDYFEENLGQVAGMDNNPAKDVLVRMQSNQGDLYFTTKGLVYVFAQIDEEKDGEKNESAFDFGTEENRKTNWARVDLELIGAKIGSDNLLKEEEVEDYYSNYYLGHCPEGILNVKQYKKIIFRDIYPGIDWRWMIDKDRNIKHEFVVHAGADPSVIKWKYLWAKEVHLNKDGSLLISSPIGEINEGSPFTYEEQTKGKVKSSYKLDNDIWSYDIAGYNKDNTLVIDPVLQWATYYGGRDSEGFRAMAVDNNGNLYVTGYTISTDFPVLQQPGSYFAGTNNGSVTIVILKFNINGARLWSTNYGGNTDDWVIAITKDGLGNIYLCGWTMSNNFPTEFLFGSYNQNTLYGNYDAFILKFDMNGIRKWATLYGGNSGDGLSAVKCDNLNNVYFTGSTASTNLILQNLAGAYNQNTNNGGMTDALILKFDVNGIWKWATYYGGNGGDGCSSITIDNSSNLYLSGSTNSTNLSLQTVTGAYNQNISGDYDALILKFNSMGQCVWSTCYGGTSYDNSSGIANDCLNNIFLTGFTKSSDFPVRNLPGAYNQITNAGGNGDAYILRFDPNGVRQWATYYGGSGLEMGRDVSNISIDNYNNVFLSFETQSNNILTNPGTGLDYYDGTLNGIYMDIFYCKFGPFGNLKWATYWGNNFNDFRNVITIDKTNNYLYACGEYDNGSTSTNLPLLNPGGAYFQTTRNGYDESFISRFKIENVDNICFQPNTIWQQVGTGMELKGVVNALTVYNNKLIAGGLFNTSQGTYNHIASWDGSNWSALGSGIDRQVNALIVYQGNLIAGYNTGISRWDAGNNSWVSLGLTGQIFALTVHNNLLIAGGKFIMAGGNTVNNIAAWNGTSWSPVGTGTSDIGVTALGSVRSLLSYSSSELIVGGIFANAGITNAANIAKWNGTNWSAFGSGLTLTSVTDQGVYALANFNNNIIAGGRFDRSGATILHYLSKWDAGTSSWSDIGGGLTCTSCLNDISSLIVYNGSLYAGGIFTKVGALPVKSVARWDGNSWNRLGSGIKAGSSSEGLVNCLSVFNNYLYAGGEFINPNNRWIAKFPCELNLSPCN